MGKARAKVTLEADLLVEARSFGLDVSAIVEGALEEAVKAERARRWYAENRNGNVDTADFVALAERVSRADLDTFFDVWLYRPVKPTTW